MMGEMSEGMLFDIGYADGITPVLAVPEVVKVRVPLLATSIADVTPETLGQAITELEKEMFRHAELLEFEEAARVRDQIGKLKDRVLRKPGVPV